MKAGLAPGASRSETITVDASRCIEFLGEPGRIYSTPSMVNDVEYACYRLIGEFLDEGEDSLGVHVETKHLGGTLLGESVVIDVRVSAVEGRRIVCAIEVRDRHEVVGKAKHTRVVVDRAKYLDRLAAKWG